MQARTALRILAERSQQAGLQGRGGLEARVGLDLEISGRAFKVENSRGKCVEVRRDLASPGSEEMPQGLIFCLQLGVEPGAQAPGS